ncbi:hypothetical protein EV424DRAFT_1542615 [Suillus variegatus]|nr:hypothetical protein EV424DRAFT_1542615 [Suillus variegatus]
MTYCKCHNGKQHEFLLLEFCHWNASQTATTILVVDRTVSNPDPENNSNGSSSRTSGIISPSASPTPAAVDNVFTTPNMNSAIKTHLAKTFGSYTRLCTLDFSTLGVEGPSATQIAVLLSVVSQNAPRYHLYKTQCYWFAETVWEAVKHLFSGGVEGPWVSGRSCYLGVKIEKLNSVEVVCREFNSEWARIEIEAEHKRQEKEARTQQLRDEYQAEIYRLLAKIAELESRS